MYSKVIQLYTHTYTHTHTHVYMCIYIYIYIYIYIWTSLVAQLLKNPPVMQDPLVWFLGREDPLEDNRVPIPAFLDFPGISGGKESACNVGDPCLIPGLGRSPGGGHGNPLQYSCLENPHEQRSLAGYSPWGCKESNMIELLSIAQHIHISVLFPCRLL